LWRPVRSVFRKHGGVRGLNRIGVVGELVTCRCACEALTVELKRQGEMLLARIPEDEMVDDGDGIKMLR
jgi:hypothetical protein